MDCLFILFVLVLMIQICKLRVLRQPCKVYGADWTVTLFGDDDFLDTLELGVLVVVIVTIDEHDDVGILLDGS